MALLDALDKLAGYFQPAVNDSCLSTKEIADARRATQEAFPGKPEWDTLHYPGEMSLPIFLLPAPPRFSPALQNAVTALHKELLREGVPHSQFQVHSRYEQRQTHFWIAKLARNQFLPIGQSCFILEDRRFKVNDRSADTPKPSSLRLASGQGDDRCVQRWWMHLAWLRPAYRCQLIFRHTVPYLQQWHPGFWVRDPNPPLARSLKDFPEHIFDGRVQWWDGLG